MPTRPHWPVSARASGTIAGASICSFRASLPWTHSGSAAESEPLQDGSDSYSNSMCCPLLLSNPQQLTRRRRPGHHWSGTNRVVVSAPRQLLGSRLGECSQSLGERPVVRCEDPHVGRNRKETDGSTTTTEANDPTQRTSTTKTQVVLERRPAHRNRGAASPKQRVSHRRS